MGKTVIQCLKVLKRYNLEQAPESVKDDRESPSGKFKCSPRTMTLEWGEKNSTGRAQTLPRRRRRPLLLHASLGRP